MRLKYTLLLITIASVTLAQNEWKPGYILKTQQDTVWGSLLNKKYSKNAKSINFRTNEGEKETTFVPSEIYGYRFTNGKYYVSKYVDSTHGMLFLEYLINGELDAYFYRDKYGGNHYYIEKDSLKLRELKYKNEMIYEDGKTYRKKTIEYKGVLDFYTRDTEGLKKDISNLSGIDHKSLVSFAKKYHELSCGDESCIEYGKDVKRKLLFSVDFGNFSLSSTYRSKYNRDNYQYISASFYFQQIERNENLFFLIGFNQFLDDKKPIGIPFGIEYIDLQPGLGFNGSYTIDLASFFLLHYFGAGFHYKIGNLILQTKIRIAGTIELEIAGVQPSFGIMYSIR
ncbi:MAG TPA: hypothetical protein VJ937_03755 [Salinivirga sp.]|uniref:hypothetical protein n=1 Tax=Salinivirga sp. TaxID=1970192 RepID=UPI002B4602DB|nr:hypothetical protein [Salinivirga sp.]HKK58566.1 hypothetical protein [Salinivirga sp.]